MSYQTLSHIYKLSQKFSELKAAISYFVRLSLYVKVNKLLYTHLQTKETLIFKHNTFTLLEYYEHTHSNLMHFLQTLFILRVRNSVVH
jgi:hypothetical protein